VCDSLHDALAPASQPTAYSQACVVLAEEAGCAGAPLTAVSVKVSQDCAAQTVYEKDLGICAQVACALPGASFTEEILRSMDGAETELVFSSADGDVVRRRPADVYAEAAAAAAASAGGAEAAMRAGRTSAARDV